MKQIVLLFAAVLLSGILHAQKLKESEVPATVMAFFKKSFPAAKNVKWSKESESEFEAEFKNGAQEQAANFDATGKWLVTETEIKKADLPAPVQATIKKEVDGYKMEEVEKAETPDNGILYEVELEKGETILSVQISKEGKVLKKEEEKEHDEKEKKKEAKKKN